MKAVTASINATAMTSREDDGIVGVGIVGSPIARRGEIGSKQANYCATLLDTCL